MDDDPDIESLLWTCKECYVYQIPPLKNESGHRANDWDVNKWLWQGAIKLTAKGTTLSIMLHDASTEEVFACCPVKEKGSKAVDQVIDSSRYFALRIDDGKGKHATVGLGFRDRAQAYDFNATMQDHWKGVQRQKEAEEQRQQMEARVASEPMRDLSLKEGETLSIKVNHAGSGKARAPRPKSTVTSGGGLMLPPPPGPGMLAPPPKAGAPAPVATPAAAPAGAATPAAAPMPTPTAAVDVGDDDFGDFGAFDTTSSAGAGDDDGFGDFSSAGEK